MNTGARVPIPNSVRKTIHNIKEITGNHSEEEIYAMLKECSMDPNETTQKLLLQDTFHEVKRKRDRRKENLNTKESAESRWRPGMQGRGGKAGRGNYSSRYISHDAGGGRTSAPGKENGVNLVPEKGVGLSSLPSTQETKNKETTPTASSPTVITDSPPAGSSSIANAAHLSDGSVVNQCEEFSTVDISKLGGPPQVSPRVGAEQNPTTDFGTKDTHGQLTPSTSDSSALISPAPTSGVYFSASDPVLVPSHDSWLPGAVGTIKREVGSHRTPIEQISAIPADSKATADSEVRSNVIQGKVPSKSQGIGKNQLSDSSQLASSSHGGSSVIKTSSNYHGRPQQVIGHPKVGPSKEWKPKPTNPNLAQGSVIAGSSEAPTTVEAKTQSRPPLSDFDSKEATSELQRKLEESHISDVQHVVIPNHLQVPDKIVFCFGSFDSSFDLSTSSNNDPGSESIPTHSKGTEDAMEQLSSNQNDFATGEEGDYPDHPQSPTHAPENLSSEESDISSSAVPEYSDSKQETSPPPGNNQYSMVHTSPNYSFGFMPPMLSAHLAPFESSESQARDVSRLPSFVVPQPFDPTSYGAQFYRSGADSDGRISPFHPHGVASKYNGNVAVLPPQTSQSPQEGGNSLGLSTASPTPVMTQTGGVMQSSIAATPQPVPIFRQPTGMHLPHYPPNYIPYGHYFSPFYIPPPTIHQFLSNGAFPQQPQAGSVYPAQPPAVTAKYSLPQYKPGNNTGNYTPYGSSQAGYSPSSASATGNSTVNEDLVGSQFKENSVYVTGQQTEGSAVWIAPPGRDISSLQASSFYNIPQGQMAFTPTQAGHGTFTGIYHPAQAMTPTTVHPLLQQSQTMAGPIDMTGPTTSVFQQAQHAQVNWPNSY